MGNNVIILGAGFSFDAGVPLMPRFIQTMFDLAMRKKYLGVLLSDSDQQTFSEALAVRNDLNEYHGRANFDDRNIEDILSILSFRVLSGSAKAKTQLDTFTRAIARTIEITCSVKHPGLPRHNESWKIVDDGPKIYRTFWDSLFKWNDIGNTFPTLVTFNYDLVLERSLLQHLISRDYEGRAPRDIRVNYHYPHAPSEIWRIDRANYTTRDYMSAPGTVLRKTGSNGSSDLLEIDLLKLHGSLNFPNAPLENAAPSYNIAESRETPYILPPIFNKLSSDTPRDMWRVALDKIGNAQNIIIVGYSLPQTDIYMQYFLKAAVGPNLNLNKIIVFNPALFADTPECKRMMERYALCFSEQLRSQIEFRPAGLNTGTSLHFVHSLTKDITSLLY